MTSARCTAARVGLRGLEARGLALAHALLRRLAGAAVTGAATTRLCSGRGGRRGRCRRSRRRCGRHRGSGRRRIAEAPGASAERAAATGATARRGGAAGGGGGEPGGGGGAGGARRRRRRRAGAAAAGEVLRPVDPYGRPAATPTPDRAERGCLDVGAVAGRVEPGGHHVGRRLLAGGDVLAQRPRPRRSRSSAMRVNGIARDGRRGVVVREIAVRGHVPRLPDRGIRERRVDRAGRRGPSTRGAGYRGPRPAARTRRSCPARSRRACRTASRRARAAIPRARESQPPADPAAIAAATKTRALGTRRRCTVSESVTRPLSSDRSTQELYDSERKEGVSGG